ncbi:xylan 1,4-beta-xylosidase, partial [Bacteroides nordii]|uniref:xylan 1,4-beta-xylosidase n=1 Tax=Bacteroides nordii TaxID=291645 RepID=UPI00241C3CB6
MRIYLFFCLFLSSLSVGAQGILPFNNPDLPVEERVEDLVRRLTLHEKVLLMCDYSSSVPRLGIKQYNWWNEALHGVGRAGLATVFPQAIGMAATFDDCAVKQVFECVSDEARAKYHHSENKDGSERYQGLTFWTPNVNIFRDPRWGRGQETYGEDPYLTSRMGLAVVRGLQGPPESKYDKLHACAKHYALHSGPEWNRHRFDVENISPRDLWETYLPAFKALVQQGGVKEVMCAYNRFEGEPCCGSNRLLYNILREEWGFDGLVVSDCGAISDFYLKGHHETHSTKESAVAAAVKAGTDLDCGVDYQSLEKAVEEGIITEKQIDVSLSRLLKARFELGLMDEEHLVSWSDIPYTVVDSEKHRAKALEIARKSMTLLKNKNGTLPLSKHCGKIAVIGPNANDSIMMWGNYNGFPSHTVTILEGITHKLVGGQVIYDKGCELTTGDTFVSLFNRCSWEGKIGFKASYWNQLEFAGKEVTETLVGSPFNFHTGGATVFAPGVNLNNFTACYQSIFCPEEDRKVTFNINGDDGYRLFVNGKKVIDYWGQHGAESRSYTLDAHAGMKYDIRIEYMQAGGEGILQFDLGYTKHFNPNEIAATVSDAEAIVFVGGISPKVEGEELPVSFPGFRGGDRTVIELPQVQRDLLQELYKTGKPIILILCSGSAIGLSAEVDLADAIIQAWYPGQAGGTAVADVLFGDYNPAGRLPVTFYKATEQLPDFEDYNMQGRTYRYFKGEALFPFGYGLSYTSFEIGKAQLSKKRIHANESVNLDLWIKNTGERDGEEVIQVYIRKNKGSYQKLDRELAEVTSKGIQLYCREILKKGNNYDICAVYETGSTGIYSFSYNDEFIVNEYWHERNFSDRDEKNLYINGVR